MKHNRIGMILTSLLLGLTLMIGFASCVSNTAELVIGGGNTEEPATEFVEANKNGTFQYEVNEAGYYDITGYTPASSKVVEVTVPSAINGLDVTGIASNAFYYCPYISKITIPDSITAIADYAFAGCSELTSLVIPDTVKTVGVGVFANCTALTSAKLPASLKEIPASTFTGCTALKTYEIADTITAIGAGAFMGCSALEAVVLPDSVVELGECAFYNCQALVSFQVGAQLTFEKIGDYALARCNEAIVVDCPAESGMKTYLDLIGTALVGQVPEVSEVAPDQASPAA